MKFREIAQLTQPGSYRIHVPWDYLDKWIKDHEKHDLELSPDFQRAHVWSEEQQQRYVEFILRGGRSARDIYFNCPGWMGDFRGPLQLVDGKQRLQAVCKFLANEMKVFADESNEEDGYLFREFTDRLPLDAAFEITVNNLSERHEVLLWYLEMNSGGVVHTKHELDKVRKLLAEEIY